MLGLKEKTKAQEFLKISEAEKRQIIEDYLQSGLTKRAIWEKYTGCKEEHGQLLRWMRKYGYLSRDEQKRTTFVSLKSRMEKHPPKQELVSDFEHLQLKRRISELEKQLQESEMKSIAWQTMIEIAERELNISIKKKFNTKPSGK